MASIAMVALFLISHIFNVLSLVTCYIVTHSVQVTWGCASVVIGYFLFRHVFAIKVTVHPATTKVVSQFIQMFQEESMFCEEGIPHMCVGDELDADLTPPTSSGQSDSTQEPLEKAIKSKRRIHYAVRVAHLAKSEVGLLNNTKANELVYARLCREAMIKHGVRRSHIAHAVPIAVAACFMPLDEDFLAASIRQSSQMKERWSLLGPLYWK